MTARAGGAPRKGVGVVVAAVVVSLVIWALARVLGVELIVGKGPDAGQVSSVDVLVAASLAGLAAWGVRTLLVRRRADGLWPVVGSTALAVSVIGPTWLADGSAAVVLICMHAAVGLVLIVGFADTGRAPHLPDQRSHVGQ